MKLFISLLPGIIMILLVIFTHKVVISMLIGILLGALIFNNFDMFLSFKYIYDSIYEIVTDFSWHMPIVGFLLLLGVITAFLTVSGSTKAFADWAVAKIKNRKSAQYLAWILGIIIFIDDYFNALVIGEISKPITDRYKISRAKLAYIIDSTSAPVVILLPISTWGAYVIGLLTKIFAEIGYDKYSGTEVFWNLIPMQFYAIVALIMVFLVIKFDINMFTMKKYERKVQEGEDISCNVNNNQLTKLEVESNNGTKWGLIITILSLVIGIILNMLYSADWNVSNMLSVDITLPLFRSAIISTVISLLFVLLARGIKLKGIFKSTFKGIYSMIPASIILIAAWTLTSVIADLKTGEYIAEWVVKSNIDANFLPPILFIIGSCVAFMTGTSWGTFGILLPIAGEILVVSNPTMVIPAIAAVLSGAILGDHCSPISDTTVLSATGAKSKLESHFISQLPYVIISGIVSFTGFIVFSYTGKIIYSYISIIILLILFVLIYKKLANKLE